MTYDYDQKRPRVFIANVSLPDNPFGRNIKILAKSSLEAGAIMIKDELIPEGYVCNSLIDPNKGA